MVFQSAGRDHRLPGVRGAAGDQQVSVLGQEAGQAHPGRGHRGLHPRPQVHHPPDRGGVDPRDQGGQGIRRGLLPVSSQLGQ